MRAVLWQGSGEDSALVRESLRGLFTLAGIAFDVADTREALLATAAQSQRTSDLHIIVIDCYHGEPSDIDRCAGVIAETNQTKPSIHVVHPDEQAVRDLAGIAGRPLGWLPSDFTVPILREKLHALRAATIAEASQATARTRPVLTPREREVAALIVEGKDNREIEAALHLTKSTVKTHMRTLLRKFEVKTRSAFIARYRNGGREG